MEDAQRDDLVRRLDEMAVRMNTRFDRLEDRVRRLEQHTAAVLDQIVALRQGLDDALSDLVEEDADDDGMMEGLGLPN